MTASREFEDFVSTLLDVPPQPQQDVALERLTFAAEVAKVPTHPNVTIIPATSASGPPCEWLLPARLGGQPPSSLEPAILYLHGGGFVVGSAETGRPAASFLAALSDVPVLNVDYALAPERPFPAALADVIAAYRWLRNSGVPPRRVAVAGESAGANLAIALQLQLRDLEPPAECSYLMSPGVDLSPAANISPGPDVRDPWITDSMMANVRASYVATEAELLNPLVSPVFADLRDLPPLLVQFGAREVMRDSIRRFIGRARRDGVDVTAEEWPEMFHCWATRPGSFPEAEAALLRAARFLRERLEGAPSGRKQTARSGQHA